MFSCNSKIDPSFGIQADKMGEEAWVKIEDGRSLKKKQKK